MPDSSLVGRVAFGGAGTTIQDMEDILLERWEKVVDDEAKAMDEFSDAYNNWILGEATRRMELEREGEMSKPRWSDSRISAELRISRKTDLKPLWDAYVEKKKAKDKAVALRKKEEPKIPMQRSKNYRKRM